MPEARHDRGVPCPPSARGPTPPASSMGKSPRRQGQPSGDAQLAHPVRTLGSRGSGRIHMRVSPASSGCVSSRRAILPPGPATAAAGTRFAPRQTHCRVPREVVVGEADTRHRAARRRRRCLPRGAAGHRGRRNSRAPTPAASQRTHHHRARWQSGFIGWRLSDVDRKLTCCRPTGACPGAHRAYNPIARPRRKSRAR